MFKLVISDDEGKTTVVPLVREEITIGRKEGNTIRLTERNVSRRHAKLMKANGAFLVEDLKSYNGVKVNGRKIDGSVSLNAGDQIGIGDYLLALQLDAAANATADAVTAAVAAPGTADAATAMIAAPAEPAPPARLVMLSPPAPGAEFALSKDRIRIGRAEDLDAWVNHRSISREHAEVAKEGNGYKVVDLGSANGVRLNGQEVSSAPLSPGDVLEFGQVRFRFVGEGESYVFDADRTIQMEAVEAPEGMPKAPIMAALGIVGVAVVVAAVFALGGGGTEEQQPVLLVDPPSEPGPTETGPEESPTVADDGYDEAVAVCQRHLDDGQLLPAFEAATRALTLRPDGSDAEACKASAQAGMDEQQIFDRALRLRDDGQLDEAWLSLTSLREGSPYRSRSEFGSIRNALIRQHMQQGRDSLRRDAEQTLTHVNAVLGIEGISARQQRAAEQLQAQAEGGGRRPTTGSRPTTGRNPRGQPQQQQQQQQQQPPTPTPPRRCNPADSNYSRCIIDTLEGRARSAGEMAQLIEAYRGTGNMAAALRHMQTFVRRFPGHPRANAYRQILLARGIEVAP